MKLPRLQTVLLWCVRAVLFLLGLLAAAIIAAWLTGRIVSDRHLWSQWLLWIPTPAALLAGCLGLLCAAIPVWKARRRRWGRSAWLVVTVLLVVYFALLEHRLLSFPPSEPAGLKLVHWNLGKARREPDDPFARRIVDLDGDITILTHAVRVPRTEVIRDWLGEGRRPVRVGRFVILTRLPVYQVRWLVSEGEIHLAMVEIDTTDALGRPIVLYLIDLPSDPRRPRAEIARKVRSYLDEIERETPPADAVIGDFNITRGSASLSMAMPDLRHAFGDAGHGYGATFHQAFPLYHIDHILLAPTLRCTRYDLIDPGLGRHRAQAAWVVDDR
ncbi:MAG: hypothetical protein SYC29_12640 [Planctomycetota bacterium]|nr:hypothetical protein [Planctomycetota bacterium]